MDLTLRVADHRPQSISQRQALVCDDCQPPGGAARLSCAQECAGNPDAVSAPGGRTGGMCPIAYDAVRWACTGLRVAFLVLAPAGRLAIWGKVMRVRRAVSS